MRLSLIAIFITITVDFAVFAQSNNFPKDAELSVVSQEPKQIKQ